MEFATVSHPSAVAPISLGVYVGPFIVAQAKFDSDTQCVGKANYNLV